MLLSSLHFYLTLHQSSFYCSNLYRKKGLMELKEGRMERKEGWMNGKNEGRRRERDLLNGRNEGRRRESDLFLFFSVGASLHFVHSHVRSALAIFKLCDGRERGRKRGWKRKEEEEEKEGKE
jgi:hypothetical protein